MTITIRGDKEYEKKLYNHLLEEHPSTRDKMTISIEDTFMNGYRKALMIKGESKNG